MKSDYAHGTDKAVVIVAGVDPFDADGFSGGGRVDELVIAYVHSDVSDTVAGSVEEYQISGFELGI